MARQVLENGVILPAEYSDDWYNDMTSNLTKLDDVIGSDSEKLSSSDVGAAALSNNYNDLDNLPTIPTVNDATLTIQKNGVNVQTFTANASSNVTCNITVPTKTSDLTNDSNFVDTSNPAVSSGITSAKVTDYDTHIADTDIHVTASDKTTWNTVTSKAQDSDVVHKSGNETVGGEKTFTSSIKGYNSDSTQNTVSIDLRTSKVSRGSTTDGTDTFGFGFRDKNNSALASISCVKRSTGEISEYHTVNTTDNSNNVLSESYSFNLRKDGTSTLRPETNDKILLGTASNKWKDVNTYLINGLTPSSLSLPSDRSARIDISSYFTNTGSGNTNYYSVPANGYIFFNLLNVFAVTCYSIDGTNNINYAQNYFRAVDGQIYILFPVRKNDKFGTLWATNGGTITVTGAYFIPCQGNV